MTPVAPLDKEKLAEAVLLHLFTTAFPASLFFMTKDESRRIMLVPGLRFIQDWGGTHIGFLVP